MTLNQFDKEKFHYHKEVVVHDDIFHKNIPNNPEILEINYVKIFEQLFFIKNYRIIFERINIMIFNKIVDNQMKSTHYNIHK